MSDSRAFTYYINPFGSSPDENNSVNISSPGWVLTFIRWKYRDTLRIPEIDALYSDPDGNSNLLQKLKLTEDPLIVMNDCIDVSVVSNKNSFTPHMEATLLFTDVNYLTAIAPGDFVLVNMLNWNDTSGLGIKDGQVTPEDIYNRVRNGNQSINGINDGFKGVFKVQSVRRTTAVINSETGAISVVFKIEAFAFTEFNNMLYFDPSVTMQTQDSTFFASQISETWKQLVSANKDQNIQELIVALISSFIGVSSIRKADKAAINNTQFQTPNDKFYMPGIIGTLLGVPNVQSAKDIYNYLFGIQTYSNTGSNVLPQDGLNPDLDDDHVIGSVYPTVKQCQGRALLLPEYWNQVKAWDILNQYTNRPLNEFFTCFRVDPYNGNVMPTVILRQIPFTTEDFYVNNANYKDTSGSVISYSNVPTTRFMTLPRWKVHPSLVFSQDIGRDEAARVNYVQLFARLLQIGSLGSDYTLESSNHNYVFDLNDIQRSGLRPNVTSNMFDIFPSGGDNKRTSFNSPIWARIYADALIGGQLKFNGTFVCVGISDPISVGDNFEFDDVVYHIEQVVHTCSIDVIRGIKQFRTIVSVSNGLSVYSSKQNGTLYPEMDYTNAYKKRDNEYGKVDNILPGVSESQSTPSRKNALDNTSRSPNTSFPQPKKIKLFPDKNKPTNGNGKK